jgi:hypothetical protein
MKHSMRTTLADFEHCDQDVLMDVAVKHAGTQYNIVQLQ